MPFPSASPFNGPWPPSSRPSFHKRVGELMGDMFIPEVHQCEHCKVRASEAGVGGDGYVVL